MKQIKKTKIFFLVSAIVLTLIAAMALSALLGAEEVSVEPAGTPLAFIGTDSPFFRVLVAGSDATSGLCDVMMLVSLERETGKVCVLQLPRDTYAAYTDGGYRKLNGALHALGSMRAVADFLSEALGVPIDRTLHLSPTAFRSLVDAVGGVEIELSEPMHYEDPVQGLSIHLEAGRQVLDGAKAEQFVRYRSGYARGDLERMDAQKQFLSALFSRLSGSLTPATVTKLVGVLLREVETDLTATELLSLVGDASGTRREDICFVTAPGAAATAKVSGASYYVLSSQGMDELMCLHFGAKQGSFDPKKVFLNSQYASFRTIYNGKTAYRLTKASDFG